jgi:signal transduction histidine kinase
MATTENQLASKSYQADIDAVQRIAAVKTILEVVCRSTGMGFAAVARVTEDRWIACDVLDKINFGLKAGGELKIESTICNEIRQSRNPVIIDHVAEDKDYCNHHTPRMYQFQSYISMPIILPNDTLFGTLCAIDPKPAKLKGTEVEGMFKLFAELLGFHLNAIERLDASEANLAKERHDSVLREQFIAVLGHDLRNPLAAVHAEAKQLRRMNLGEGVSDVASVIDDSVKRMSGLIDDVLDFARGRLGGGLSLQRDANESLESVLKHVSSELQLAHPDKPIRADIVIRQPVNCDPKRIAQLFSNLLGNALSYGAPNAAVTVEASSDHENFELAVANGGDPIPEAVMESLFQPFFRGKSGASQEGLGLGLYIASEIARAHGGTLTVASNETETRFKFKMPVG